MAIRRPARDEVLIDGVEAEDEETAIGRVLVKLRDDILNRSVEGW